MIQYLDLSFPIPHPNLACDEALLDFCEERNSNSILRFWQPENYFVVLGYSNKISTEVNINSCTSHNIPVLRRISGGGTILQAPGCLNYSLILKISDYPELRTIQSSTDFIMNKHRESLSQLTGLDLKVQGISDLTLGGLKFSGNAQRRKQQFMLFHGSFLLDADIEKISRVLNMPSKQPDYRQNRSHQDFLTNLGVCSEKVKENLKNTWEAFEAFTLTVDIENETRRLVEEKYSRPEWNEKF